MLMVKDCDCEAIWRRGTMMRERPICFASGQVLGPGNLFLLLCKVFLGIGVAGKCMMEQRLESIEKSRLLAEKIQ